MIDNGSTDQTAQVAEKLGCKVIQFEHSSFARIRNEALKHTDSQWLFYVDADERVTPTLAKEILVNIETNTAKVMSMGRKNICYGQEFGYGGWELDQVTRIFHKDALKEWQGKVHETPVYQGKNIILHTPLIHLTHRSTEQNLIKSASWTKIEAQLIHKSGVAPVTFFTLMRKGIMEFIRRSIINKGYKDKLPGLIEALVQAINKVFIYIQVWELQQTPSISDQYRKREIEIKRLWENEKVEKLNSKTKKQ